MNDLILKRFKESADVIKQTGELLCARIEAAVDMIVETVQNGGGLFIFGNGGSAADAQHIAAEMVGRYMVNRRAFKAVALTTDTSIITAVANDLGYDVIFSRQLEALAKEGDIAIGISTSGNSPNVLTGFAKARQMKLKTIAFTGNGGGNCTMYADILLDVPSKCTPRIQESHIAIYHTIFELVEQRLAK